VRARLLEGAGLAFVRQPADIDEDAIKRGLLSSGADAETLAAGLAEAKAVAVSAGAPGALVIGADQTLECGASLFDKPASEAEAARQLRSLGGRTHLLVSALSVARDGAVLWRHAEEARLTMRCLSDGFIADYLDRAGPAALDAVGSYHLEGLGVHLFSRIDGDYFAILGLPLLPLLDFLRREGAIDG
jgi:septum formation protein